MRILSGAVRRPPPPRPLRLPTDRSGPWVPCGAWLAPRDSVPWRRAYLRPHQPAPALQATYDLILLDVNLPNMSGYALCSWCVPPHPAAHVGAREREVARDCARCATLTTPWSQVQRALPHARHAGCDRCGRYIGPRQGGEPMPTRSPLGRRSYTLRVSLPRRRPYRSSPPDPPPISLPDTSRAARLPTPPPPQPANTPHRHALSLVSTMCCPSR